MNFKFLLIFIALIFFALIQSAVKSIEKINDKVNLFTSTVTEMEHRKAVKDQQGFLTINNEDFGKLQLAVNGLSENVKALSGSIDIHDQMYPPTIESNNFDELQLAVKGLSENVKALAGSIKAQDRIVPLGISGEPPRLKLKVPIDIPDSLINSVWIIFVILLVIFIIALRSKNLRTYAPILGISTVLSFFLARELQLNNHFEIGHLFQCENCGLKLEFGGSLMAIRPFEASPSFDVGTEEIAKPTIGCLENQYKTKWNSWFSDRATDWLQRANPTDFDLIILVGSSDRQHLNDSLAKKFDSNDGLARARAENVKLRLINEINDRDPSNSITESRFMIFSNGPKNTSSDSKNVSKTKSNCDLNLADDRKVRIWFISAAPK